MTMILNKCIVMCVIASLSGEIIPNYLTEDLKSLVGHFGVRNLAFVHRNTGDGLISLQGSLIKELFANLKHHFNVFSCPALRSRFAVSEAMFYPLSRSEQPCDGLETKQLLISSNVNNPLLLYALNETKLPSWVSQAYIPYNASVFVILRNALDTRELTLQEIYHLYDGSELMENTLGRRLVDEVGVLKWKFNAHAYDTQMLSDMKGFAIKASYPQVMFDSPDSDFAKKYLTVETLLKAACNPVNLSIEAVPLVGVITLAHVLEPITTGKADVSLVPLYMAADHMHEMEYLSPYKFSSSRIFVRRPEFSYSLSSVVKSFTLSAWLASGGILLSLSVAMTINYKVMRHCGYDNEPQFSVTRCVLMSLRIFCAQGWERLPSSSSGRVVAISSLFIGFFLNSLFVLQLQAGLASKQSQLPFRDLAGLAQTDYQIFSPRSTQPLTSIQNGTTEVMKKLRTKLRYYGKDALGNIPLNATCLEKIAIVTAISNIDMYVDRSACPIVDSQVDLFLQWITLGTTLNFQFKKLISRSIRRLAETGIVKRNEIKAKMDVKIFSEGIEFEVIEFAKVKHFLLLIAAAVASSLVIFILELTVSKVGSITQLDHGAAGPVIKTVRR